MRQVIDELVHDVPSSVCEERAQRITRNLYYVAHSITVVVFVFYVVNLVTWVRELRYFDLCGRAIESVAFGICAISMLVGAYMINSMMRTYSSILSDEVGRKRLLWTFGTLTVACTGQFLSIALYYSFINNIEKAVQYTLKDIANFIFDAPIILIVCYLQYKEWSQVASQLEEQKII